MTKVCAAPLPVPTTGHRMATTTSPDAELAACCQNFPIIAGAEKNAKLIGKEEAQVTQSKNCSAIVPPDSGARQPPGAPSARGCASCDGDGPCYRIFASHYFTCCWKNRMVPRKYGWSPEKLNSRQKDCLVAGKILNNNVHHNKIQTSLKNINFTPNL